MKAKMVDEITILADLQGPQLKAETSTAWAEELVF